MKAHIFLFIVVLNCWVLGAVAYAQKPTTDVSRNSILSLVKKLDVIRLPASSFMVDVTSIENPTGEATRNLSFRLYSKPFPSRATATLIIMRKPEEDQNKLVLMKDTKVWFYDPRSRNATVLSAKQFWQHSFVADSLTLRIEDQYEAKLAGHELIDTLDNGRVACDIIELSAKAKAVTAAESVHYWLNKDGRPYKCVYFAASGKPIRSCQFGKFAFILGAQRPTLLVVNDIKGSASYEFSSFNVAELPDSIFDPDNLSRLQTK